MNLITFIRHRLQTHLSPLHAPAHAASCPTDLRPTRGPRLRATWLAPSSQGRLRLHWQVDDSQEPPSRWRALFCFG
jgi:hypothetical protein